MLPERGQRVVSVAPSGLGPSSYSMDNSVADQTHRREERTLSIYQKSAETEDGVV